MERSLLIEFLEIVGINDGNGHVKLLNITAHGESITERRSRESCDLFYLGLDLCTTPTCN
jgi:hypothetical protein